MLAAGGVGLRAACTPGAWHCPGMSLPPYSLPAPARPPAAAHPGSRVKSFATCGELRYAVLALFDSTVTVWDLHTLEAVAVLQRWGERDASKGHSSGTELGPVHVGLPGRGVLGSLCAAPPGALPAAESALA